MEVNSSVKKDSGRRSVVAARLRQQQTPAQQHSRAPPQQPAQPSLDALVQWQQPAQPAQQPRKQLDLSQRTLDTFLLHSSGCHDVEHPALPPLPPAPPPSPAAPPADPAVAGERVARHKLWSLLADFQAGRSIKGREAKMGYKSVLSAAAAAPSSFAVRLALKRLASRFCLVTRLLLMLFSSLLLLLLLLILHRLPLSLQQPSQQVAGHRPRRQRWHHLPRHPAPQADCSACRQPVAKGLHPLDRMVPLQAAGWIQAAIKADKGSMRSARTSTRCASCHTAAWPGNN